MKSPLTRGQTLEKSRPELDATPASSELRIEKNKSEVLINQMVELDSMFTEHPTHWMAVIDCLFAKYPAICMRNEEIDQVVGPLSSSMSVTTHL